jgi:hypothetical protein
MFARYFISLAVVLAVGAASTAEAQEQPIAGRVKVASGDAYILRAGSQIPAKVGEPVFQADSLRTGTDGRLGVTMKDDTRVSLGPSSEVRRPDRRPSRLRDAGRARACGLRVGSHRQAGA